MSVQGIRIDHIEEPGGLEALAPEWDDLLAQVPHASIFLTHTWVSTWWQTFGRDFRLHLLTARSGSGDLVGVAPLMIGRGPGRLVGRLPHLMLIGQRGETLAEHLDLIVRPDLCDAVVPALLEAALAIEDRFDVLLFERMRADAPELPALKAGLESAGLEVCLETDQPSPYLELPSSWDAFLAARSRNFRRQYRNSVNRLAREGAVRLHLAGRDLPLEEAFDHLVRLHRARWGEGDGSFATESYLAFHRALSKRLLENDALLLALLQVDGRTVAARYDFLCAGKVWCFQSGRLPEFERMRPGTVLLGEVLAWAIEHGYGEYDFLSGGEGYKDRWATGARSLVDLRAWRPGLRVRWVRRLARVKDALRGMRRRGPGKRPAKEPAAGPGKRPAGEAAAGPGEGPTDDQAACGAK